MEASPLWRWLRIFGLAIAFVFLLGTTAGFTIAWLKRGDGLDLGQTATLVAIGIGLLGCGWLLVRQVQAGRSEYPLTSTERLNRKLTVASGALGGAIALILGFAGSRGAAGGDVFSNAPIAPTVAILLILMMGVLLPAITVYWHRIIDEQEAAAYKSGALVGLYVYAIGTPVWWLAWRGGFVPAPNAFIIYFATIFALGGVWIWKKYR